MDINDIDKSVEPSRGIHSVGRAGGCCKKCMRGRRRGGVLALTAHRSIVERRKYGSPSKCRIQSKRWSRVRHDDRTPKATRVICRSSHCSCSVCVGSCQANLKRSISLKFKIRLCSRECLVGILVHYHFDRTNRCWSDELTPSATNCRKP